MIHNFESWRQSTMRKFEFSNASRHYHRVDDEVYYAVSDLLKSLLKAKVEHNGEISVSLSNSLADMVYEFLLQMELSYIHPRSDSAKFLFARLSPARPAHV